MITFPMMPSVDVNVFLLIFIGIAGGTLSGFAGAGAAVIVMPALIILGFPAHYAVGTSLTWIMGNAVVGTFRHWKLGSVDIKLGLIIGAATMSGVEVGVRIINWVKDVGVVDEVVLSISISVLFVVGIYILLECVKRKQHLDKLLKNNEEPPPSMRVSSLSRKLQNFNIPPILHFTKSEITISLWIILLLGFFTGMTMSILGVGGGLIIVPALVYLIGLPSYMAVGTSLFQTIFSAAYGSIRHTISGNVIIFSSFILLVASSLGALLS